MYWIFINLLSNISVYLYLLYKIYLFRYKLIVHFDFIQMSFIPNGKIVEVGTYICQIIRKCKSWCSWVLKIYLPVGIIKNQIKIIAGFIHLDTRLFPCRQLHLINDELLENSVYEYGFSLVVTYSLSRY